MSAYIVTTLITSRSRMMVTTICLSQADGDRSTSASAGSSCDTPSGDEEVRTIRTSNICVEDNVEDWDGNDGDANDDEEENYCPVDKKAGTGEPQPADALEVLHISSGDYHNSYKIGTQIQNHKYKKKQHQYIKSKSKYKNITSNSI